jgi:hypothetical protein
MKTPTFLHGAIAAAALAFVASAMIATLTPFLGVGTVLRLAVPVLAASYLVYFFRSSRQRTGRVVTWSLWTALAVVTWWAAPPLPFYLLVHAGAVWLVRSLYSYSGVIPALMDLGLCALSAFAFGWVFLRTGGVFLATWSFPGAGAVGRHSAPNQGGNRGAQRKARAGRRQRALRACAPPGG